MHVDSPSQTAMNTHDLDTRCGFCESRGRRQIADRVWLLAPVCPDCGGTGYLVTSPDAERLLTFLERHLGHRIRWETHRARAEVSPAPM